MNFSFFAFNAELSEGGASSSCKLEVRDDFRSGLFGRASQRTVE
jgi:hypothetical protein